MRNGKDMIDVDIDGKIFYIGLCNMLLLHDDHKRSFSPQPFVQEKLYIFKYPERENIIKINNCRI